MKLRAIAPLAALAATGLVACGCGQEQQPAQQGGGQAQQQAGKEANEKQAEKKAGAETVGAPGAEVSFIRPKEGASARDTVRAKLDLSGFTIDPKAVGQKPEEGHGHLHFQMDGGKLDFPKYSGPNGELAEKLGVEGKYSPSVEPQITYRNVPPGEHTLKVFLANNDHSHTGVEASTNFSVR